MSGGKLLAYQYKDKNQKFAKKLTSLYVKCVRKPLIFRFTLGN